MTPSVSLNQVSAVSVQAGSKKILDVLHLKARSLPLFYLFTFDSSEKSYCVLHRSWLSILTALFLGFITQGCPSLKLRLLWTRAQSLFRSTLNLRQPRSSSFVCLAGFALDKRPADIFRVGMEHLTPRVSEQEGCLRLQRGCQPQK